MLSDAAAMISIFVLVPLLAAFLAMRSYRRLAQREREERARQQPAPADNRPGTQQKERR